MRRLRLLDLFCRMGGAAKGYRDAGFIVVGVDLEDCSRGYVGHAFVQSDALDFVGRFGHLFDAIHASPPCQRYCTPTNYNGNHHEYPDLVEPTRAALRRSGLPYVIENVPGAPLENATTLCGTMFGLSVYRHRGFETNWSLQAPSHPKHSARCQRNGFLPTPEKPFMTITGGRHSRAWMRAAAATMGVPWMNTIKDVCEAIPPSYTQYVGEQMMKKCFPNRTLS